MGRGSMSWLVVVGVCFLSLGAIDGVQLPGYSLDVMEPIDLNSLSNVTYSDKMLGRMIMPYYVEGFFDLLQTGAVPVEEVLKGVESDVCKGHILEWMLRISNLSQLTEEDVWSLHMIDAWGKPPEGLLTGHVNALGDFDECVDLQVKNMEVKNTLYPNTAKDFEGRYCNTFLIPYNQQRFGKYFDNITEMPDMSGRKGVTPERLLHLIGIIVGVKVFPSFAVCFSNSCDKPDIEMVLMNIFKMFYGSRNRTQLVWPGVEHCYVGKTPDLDAGDISVLVLLGIIVGLCVISSLVDIALNRGLDKPPKRSFAFQCLFAFSLYTNIPKWLSTRPTADDLGCLHGIRFLSTSWIVLAHTWYVITFFPNWNLVDVKLLQEDWMILTVLNSTISVDTFFVLSGLLVGYNVLKMLAKTKGKLNIPMFYVHRYLRLTPVYAVLVGVMATLVPYMGRGPYWFIMERWGEICVDNWWTNMLYVNNFVNTSWLCQGEAWYLANDMQFYIVSPAFLLPLYHWEKIGVALLAVATLLSTLSPALLVYFLETAPTTIGTRDVQKWFTDIYIKPYARIQTYFVGMWLGYILFKTKGKQVKLPLPVVLLFWAISTGACLACLYGIQPWFDPEMDIPRVGGAFYAGLSRLAWSISICWIIFACVKGYGWIINDFLSWKAFMPLGRLCYCVYLVSLHLQMILHLSMKQPITYSNYSMTNFFFAHMIMAFLVGFFFTMTVETPFMVLEKLLLEGGSRPPRPVTSTPTEGANNGEERNGIFYNANAAQAQENGRANPKQE